MDANTVVTSLNGVGEKRALLYKKLGISTVGELINHFPRGYTDYSVTVEIASAPVYEHAVVKAEVIKKIPAARIRQGLVLYKVIVRDDSDTMTVTLYNNRFAYEALCEGEEYIFSGKISGGFTRKEMNTPQFIKASDKIKLRPVYALTEGLTSKMLITNISAALSLLGADFFEDHIPSEIRLENSLSTYEYAVKNIHFPQDAHAAELAKKRLAFDEMLTLQLGMRVIKNRNRSAAGFRLSPHTEELSEFCSALPFRLTNAQHRAVEEIVSDMCGAYPMNRLLQGDVGSGKTAVAAAAAFAVCRNGCQVAMMAPTEILARQHFATLKSLLEPHGIKVCCLTGSMSAKQRREENAMIASGEYGVIVGTHALISESTEFNKLALVIMDEQHRFGVNQRARLAQKSVNPHRLVMSATPIPRTLALIIYGDLDISVLNELPKGRKKIETFAVTSKLRERAYNFVKKQLDEGRQAYIVCPMIDEGVSELAAAKSYAQGLSKTVLSGYDTGVLHGKMSAADKEAVMSDFKSGRTALLVATTVVEVGVDVPNATVMMIENAERFGLSQLHQLRGRVGRGQYSSYCVLIAENLTDEVRERLKIMTQTSDGFKISEYDLKLRGAGDFFGERQHGLPEMKIADIASDTALIAQTAAAAAKITDESPDLSAYPLLKADVERMFDKNTEDGMN